MNWKLILYTTAGAALAWTLPHLIFFGTVSPVLVTLTAVLAFLGSTLLSLMMRVSARKATTKGLG